MNESPDSVPGAIPTREHGAGSVTYVFLITLVAALGGLLFGYDTGVINGAIGPMKAHFGFTPRQEGWAMGCALLGCALGAGAAGALSDRFGRKKVLVLSAILFPFGPILSRVLVAILLGKSSIFLFMVPMPIMVLLVPLTVLFVASFLLLSDLIIALSVSSIPLSTAVVVFITAFLGFFITDQTKPATITTARIWKILTLSSNIKKVLPSIIMIMLSDTMAYPKDPTIDPMDTARRTL